MKKEIKVQLDSKEWEGTYSNFLLITNSSTEFILDFARMMPGNNRAKIFSRIITNPTNFKLFVKQMEEVLKKYEEKNGEINIERVNTSNKTIGF